jgi:hypothetical protein
MHRLRLLAEPVDGPLGDPVETFQGPVDALARAGEERIDEVTRVDARFADELAQS